MATIDDVEIPSLLLAEQGSAPTTPASGFGRLYAKATGVFFIGDDGVEIGPLGAGGGGGGVAAESARMYRSAAWTITNTSASHPIPFDTDSWDTGSDTNTSTGEYTAPSTGKYRVTSRAGVTALNAERFFLSIHVNGTEVSRGADVISHSASAAVVSPLVTDLVAMTAADVMTVRIRQVGGSGRDLEVGAALTYMSVERVE